jgi:hypothetical protein
MCFSFMQLTDWRSYIEITQVNLDQSQRNISKHGSKAMYVSSNIKLKIAATTVLMTMLTAVPMAHAKCSDLLNPDYCRIKDLMERRHAMPDYKLKLRAPANLATNPVTNVIRPAVQPNGGQIITRQQSKLTLMP